MQFCTVRDAPKELPVELHWFKWDAYATGEPALPCSLQ